MLLTFIDQMWLHIVASIPSTKPSVYNIIPFYILLIILFLYSRLCYLHSLIKYCCTLKILPQIWLHIEDFTPITNLSNHFDMIIIWCLLDYQSLYPCAKLSLVNSY